MRILLSCLFVLMLIPQAWAAMVAEFRNLGFSPDGRHFAFMEHGVQDGSGFPFANVFVIDLNRDAWMGPPVRVLIRQEAEDARAAMRRALRLARPMLERAGIDSLLTGRELFHAPPTEGTGPAITATFTIRRWQVNDPHRRYELRLSTFPLPGGDCAPDMVEGARGFALDVRPGQTGRYVRLHADSRIPPSRHCPVAYAIDRVIHHLLPRGAPRTVIIIRFAYPAFEGFDERYLAIPVRLPKLPSAR